MVEPAFSARGTPDYRSKVSSEPHSKDQLSWDKFSVIEMLKKNRLVNSVVLLCGIGVCHAQKASLGPLRVGAAKVEITPSPVALPKNYVGILDKVYSRAILLENGQASAALITVDIIALPDPIWKRITQRISDEFAIPAKNVILAGTSTHSVPLPTGDTTSLFDDKVIESVRQAKRALQPARMSWGTGVSYINVQRDGIDPGTHQWAEGAYYDGVSDKTVSILKFVSVSGEPIAVYYNYAVFDVITGVLDEVSGDIAGATSRYIESALDEKGSRSVRTRRTRRSEPDLLPANVRLTPITNR